MIYTKNFLSGSFWGKTGEWLCDPAKNLRFFAQKIRASET